MAGPRMVPSRASPVDSLFWSVAMAEQLAQQLFRTTSRRGVATVAGGDALKRAETVTDPVCDMSVDQHGHQSRSGARCGGNKLQTGRACCRARVCQDV